jgi:hypothetical protein
MEGRTPYQKHVTALTLRPQQVSKLLKIMATHQRRRKDLISRKTGKRHPAQTAATDKHVKTIVHKILRASAELKYFDVLQAPSNSTGAVGIENMTLIPQGPAQSQRISDQVWLQHFDLRFSVNAANADVFSHMRFFFFIWKENTLTTTPTSAAIFTSAASQSVYTMLDYENRALRRLVTPDYLLNFTGTVTNPTPRSQIDIVRNFSLHNTRIDYTLGATTGINQLFFINYSDSLLTPFPSYQFLARIWYYDEPH